MKRCLPVLCLAFGLLLPACPRTEEPSTSATNTTATNTTTTAAPSKAAPALVLFQDRDAQGLATQAADTPPQVTVEPGNDTEADDYYNAIRASFGSGFPKPRLQDSNISDMLDFFGFPALLAKDIERLDPAVMMDFAQLKTKVSNVSDFAVIYHDNPLRPGELIAARFFAPKIINVRDPQVSGVPNGGFGWRKVIRFRARDGSKARAAGLDSFFLLFNFATQAPKFPPPDTHAGQLQGIVQPTYPTNGRHRDLYFLVYEALGGPNPERIGKFLVATFDLAGTVPDNKYFVPRACAQCHGSEVEDQKGAKANYLDTDHWIDRTDPDNDFPKVSPNDVLVDGVPSYATYRTFNTEIEKQNAAVGSAGFALLATRKWLDLHKVGSPNETKHVPPLGRGFVAAAGDPVWTAGATPDKDLLPLLNRYCFRCHSSVRFHVFQKKAVIQRKGSILRRLDIAPPATSRMPQDRILDAATLAKLKTLINQLQ